MEQVVLLGLNFFFLTKNINKMTKIDFKKINCMTYGCKLDIRIKVLNYVKRINLCK